MKQRRSSDYRARLVASLSALRSRLDPHLRLIAGSVIVALVAIVFITGSLFQLVNFTYQLTERLYSSEPAPALEQSNPAPDEPANADASQDRPSATTSQAERSEPAPASHRMAFLFLGYGGADHAGAYLTDSMMVVIVDPDQRTATMLSLPRDSWIPIDLGDRAPFYSKANTAYALAHNLMGSSAWPDHYSGPTGPGRFTLDTISRQLGIPLDYYVAVDFTTFREMIDAVGGIDVDVPVGFTALYPANDDPSIDASWTTIRFYAGEQHMDGDRALVYARTREVIDNANESNDFARSRRQRLIMQAFAARLLEPSGFIHLPKLLTIGSTSIDTNYPLPATAQLARLILGWKDFKVYQAALSTSNYLREAVGPDGAYILVPRTQDRSWDQIRAFTRRLWSDPALGVELARTRIVIQNNTGLPGVARRLSANLSALGYLVAPAETGAIRHDSWLIDRTGGQANEVMAQLADDLGISVRKELDLTADAESGEIVLEVGSADAKVINAQTLDEPDA